MRAGVIGHRSWIGMALIDRLIELGASVTCMNKGDAARPEAFTMIDEVFVISGRVDPTDAEWLAERSLIVNLCRVTDFVGARFTMLGSRADEGMGKYSKYGMRKAELQRIITDDYRPKNWTIVRSPAVFGATQDPTSRMLIPSIGREGADFVAKYPDDPADFIHVDDLVQALVRSSGGYSAAPVIRTPQVGVIRARPVDLQRLWATWFGGKIES